MKFQKALLLGAAVTLGLMITFVTITKSWTIFSYLGSNLISTSKTSENENKDNTIQVALLLDTSGSMSGLIEQAKSQLWKILNELARTEKGGQSPNLEIALYEYGNPSKATADRQINKLVDFTTDMDLISSTLFALTTDGGDEYCGQVIKASLDELEWKSQQDDLRLIYIAGNEPFSQGPVSFKTSCKNAIERGIVVNTIFCGAYEDGVITQWKDGADLTDGVYMAIDHNRETVYTETPFDQEINRLNQDLNRTYIPYGDKGIVKQHSQVQEDLNAAKYSPSNAAERANFKSTKNYKADSWDLVDAYKKDKSVLKKARVQVDSLKNVSVEALEAEINAAAAKRAAIQEQVLELDKKRRKFIEEQSKESDKDDLQNSILKSVEKQAKKKGYKVKK